MLVLSPADGRYPDDAHPGLSWVAPIGLTPRVGPDGTPAAVVILRRDGGLLHLALMPVYPDLSEGDRAVPCVGGRFRIVARSPMGDETGAWKNAAGSEGTAVARSVSLEPVEAALVKRATTQGNEVVEVEVELDIPGRRPTWPWVVEADSDRVRPLLEALLGSHPVGPAEVASAFLGVGRDGFDWIATEPDALPPPEAPALRAVATAMLPMLFDHTDGGYVLRESWPARVRASLAVPLAGMDRVGLRWSFSRFLAEIPNPEQHLVTVSEPAPFEASHLHVVNDVPLHAEGISRILVQARTGGPTGLVETEFVPGGPSVRRLGFVRETFEDLDVRWRTHATFRVGGRPRTHATEWRSTGLLAEIDTRALERAPIRIEAVPELFDHVESVEVRIGRATLVLTADDPELRVVGSAPPPQAVEVEAVLPNGTRGSVGVLRLPPEGLTLLPSHLDVGRTVDVEFRAADDVAERVAYLAVRADGGPWRTLEAGRPVHHPVRCRTALHAPVLRYRTLHVPRDREGTTGRIVESEWKESSGAVVVVEI